MSQSNDGPGLPGDGTDAVELPTDGQAGLGPDDGGGPSSGSTESSGPDTFGVGTWVSIGIGIALGVGLIALLVTTLPNCNSTTIHDGDDSSSNCGTRRKTTSSGCGTGYADDTTWDDDGDAFDNIPDPGETWYRVEAESIWPLRDVFDNQTGVDLVNVGLSVRGLHWTLTREPTPTWVRLYGGPRQVPLTVQASYGPETEGTATITLSPDQEPFDEYFLVFPGCTSAVGSPFMDHVRCPTVPLKLFPASAPQVIGTYRVDDTLFVVFSELMDGETTKLAHGAIDLVFRDGPVVRSVVSDLNLADFETSLFGNVFAVAPITATPFELVIGPTVVSRLGGALDINRDGLADPGRPFVHLVYPTLLDLCRSRADYPYPCISEEDASVTEHSFEAPIKVQVPVP
ncbi:MAG: hypothetical protein IV100_21915 [Myxococcales bacterium]|nr:hypothetical protein [Myxococcales bacterium]